MDLAFANGTFRKMLHERSFTLCTDRKPLLTVFGDSYLYREPRATLSNDVTWIRFRDQVRTISTRSWKRVHIDFTDPTNQLYFIVMVDAYSKWPEIFRMKTIISSSTIAILRQLFTQFGILETLARSSLPFSSLISVSPWELNMRAVQFITRNRMVKQNVLWTQ